MDNHSSRAASRSSKTTREEIRKYQQFRLRKLLDYVWKHSDFYRDFYLSHGIRKEDLADIRNQDLPLLTKETLMENFDAAVTNPLLKRKELERWLEENRNPRQAFHKDYIVIHTSGSSGTTGIFAYDRMAWQFMSSMVADHFSMLEQVGTGKIRVAFYMVIHGHFAGITTAMQLPEAVYDTLIISLLDSREQAIEKLNTFQPHRLMSYASCAGELAQWALAGKLKIHPQTIFVSGDPLTTGLQSKIHQAWSASIFELYSASESIYIAVRKPNQEHMTVVDNLNILQVLDEQNKTVAPNELGRVVLTNLYNYTTPILRYELGDYVLQSDPQPDYPFSTIRSVQGKDSEALRIVLDNGEHDSLHPLHLRVFFTQGLEKFQFISQRPDQVRIDYIANRNIDDGVREEFQNILDKKGAGRTSFDVRRVNCIPNDPNTGKHRLVRIDNIKAESTTSSITVGSSVQSMVPGTNESQQSWIEYNNVKLEFPNRDKCIHQVFEEQATHMPDNIAVVAEDGQLTYRELNARANQLAHSLQVLGMGPETLIAIYTERSVELIIGILGILKAGAAYVPLDPIFPEDRLSLILEDAQVPVLLTQQHLANRLPTSRARRIYLDTTRQPNDKHGEINPPNNAKPHNLVYVMFTSGSTGKPKGVMIEHRQLLNYVNAILDRLVIPPGCSFAAVSSYAMDSVNTAIFPALCSGGCIHLISRERASDAKALAAYFRRYPVDCLKIVSSHLSALLVSEDAQILPRKRLVIGGEACHWDLIVRVQKLNPDCVIFNHYGPTEATVGVTTYCVENIGTDVPSATVPIGYPLANTQVYILNSEMQTVSNGEPGEIYIGGEALARGYLNRPEQTARQFVKNPFSEDQHERLYRTGDLARYLPDGSIEFLNRIDNQVKIRGYRIELEEIEKILRQQAEVREAAVIAWEFTPVDKRLVAYVVPRQKGKFETDELERALSGKLPDYMIPSNFVLLDAFPLTVNGKIDRDALPVPDRRTLANIETLVAPRNPVESVLAEIWSKLLGQAPIGIFDNFFDLGGHSLLVTQLVARLREVFEIEFPLYTLFDGPTIAELAEYIEEILIKEINELTEDEAQRLL